MIKSLEESHSQESYRMPEKSIALKVKQRNDDEDSFNDEGKNIGHWTEEENTKYIVFVQGNRENFEKRKQRKIWKIFKTMSLFIGSRDTYQCRSHHQKMLVKYGNVSNLLKEMKFLYSDFDFPEAVAQFQKAHKIIPKQKNSIIPSKLSQGKTHIDLKAKQKVGLDIEVSPYYIEPNLYQSFYPAYTYYPQGSLQFLNFLQSSLWGNAFI